ncbi:HAD family hydrolase, partial [Corynebacterium sp. HMSC034B08]|uniref:HAD family hydrolase n=1 Tax=Corynebacterium sp. HMSC034B08 TaxID=1715135 RepID=UPI00352EDF66
MARAISGFREFRALGRSRVITPVVPRTSVFTNSVMPPSVPHHTGMVWAMQTSRLIALDMDGTLLTPEGQVPERFWQLYDDATAQSITITPASGRQLATL